MTVRTHDDLTFEEVRNCQAVRNLSRWVPAESEAIESFEDILARADAVTEGMKYVVDQMKMTVESDEFAFQNPADAFREEEDLNTLLDRVDEFTPGMQKFIDTFLKNDSL